MKSYVYGKAAECGNDNYVGCCLINLQTTWDKLFLAARVIAAVEDPKTIYCVGQRPYAQRAIIKFAKEIGATPSPGRFTPGQFTNQVTKSFVEPRLLIVADPRTDSQAVKEASYVNIPVIAFCGADSNLEYVDIAIPGNNRGRESLGLLYWLLCREVKRIKGEIPRADVREDEWASSIPVDLFFHKDIEDIEKEAAEREKLEAEQAEKREYAQEFEPAQEVQTQQGQEYQGQQEWEQDPTVPQMHVADWNQPQNMGPAFENFDPNSQWDQQFDAPQAPPHVQAPQQPIVQQIQQVQAPHVQQQQAYIEQDNHLDDW